MLQTFQSGDEMRAHYKAVRSRLREAKKIVDPVVEPPVKRVAPAAVVWTEPVLKREPFIPPAPTTPWLAVKLLGVPGTPVKERPGAPITIKRILEIVSVEYNVTILDLISQRRQRAIVIPRQVVMWLARTCTLRGLPAIGRHLGGRDHTTVMHGVRKIEQLRAADPVFDEGLASLRKLVEAA